jgi:ribosomal protein S18 acetylase RimI-like enzyme
MEQKQQMSAILSNRGAETYANAFHDYPMFTWCLPTEAGRWEKVRLFFEMMINHGLRYGRVNVTSDECEGIVHYLLPGTIKDTTWRWIRCGGLKTLLAWGQASMKRLDTISTEVDSIRLANVSEPHYYIMQIAVNPLLQGKGYGRALLTHILDRCDSENRPCYLETFKSVNVEIYKHFGFHLAEQRPVPGSELMIYAMVRPFNA